MQYVNKETAREENMSRPIRAFVSHSVDTNINPLIEVLQDTGFDPVFWKQSELSGRTFLEQTTRLLDKTDLFILIADENSSHQIFLEAGIAIGRRKPVLIVGGVNIPSDLAGVMQIRASVSDRSALKFQFKSVFDNWEEFAYSEKHITGSKVHRRTSKSTLSPSLLNSELERRIYRSLSNSIEIDNVVSQGSITSERNFVPDLAFGISGSDFFHDGLMIVEVKNQVNYATQIKATAQLQKYCEKAKAVAGLLVLGNDDSDEISVLSISPLVFKLSIEYLESLLISNDFLLALRHARNKHVHSVT